MQYPPIKRADASVESQIVCMIPDDTLYAGISPDTNRRFTQRLRPVTLGNDLPHNATTSLRFRVAILLALILVLPGPTSRADDSAGPSPALASLQAKAEQGDAKAQSNLGILYMRGRGVVQDYNQAAKWYSKAAAQGDAAAQDNLGTLYLNGQGVPRSTETAVSWFRKAAEQGDESAQYDLAQILLGGQGVSANQAEAYYWLIRASRSGNPRHIALRDKVADSLPLKLAATILDQATTEPRRKVRYGC